MKMFNINFKRKTQGLTNIVLLIFCIIILISFYCSLEAKNFHSLMFKENVIEKIHNLNYDEIPINHSFISMINSSEILLKEGDDIFLYNRDKQEKKLIAKPLNREHIILKAVYSNDWIVWIENSDKVINESEGLMGKDWFVVAKNLKTNEEIVIDKSHEIKDLKYKYSPQNIKISKDNIVYSHIDFEDDKYVSVIKTFNLSSKKLDILDKCDFDKNLWEGSICIYDSKIAWSYINSEILDKSRVYVYSDIILYDVISKEKSTINVNFNAANLAMYKDKIYTVKPSYNLNTPINIIEIDASSKIFKNLTKDNNKSLEYLVGKDTIALKPSKPEAKNDLLIWNEFSYDTPNYGLYYDLKNNEFKSIGENKSIEHIDNEFLIYKEDLKNKPRNSKILSINDIN